MPAISRDGDFAVIRLSSFGDIVLTEPITRAIKHRFPGSRLHFITRSDFAALPALFEGVDEVVPYSRERPDEAVEALAREVVFEAVLDLQNNLRSRRVSCRLKKNRLIRYRRPVLKRFLLVKMPWLYRGDLPHTVDLYGAALSRLGVELRDRVPRIRTASGQGRRVAVCPGGSSEYKRWPEASFAGLVDTLSASGVEVMLIGSEEDGEVVENVRALTGLGPERMRVLPRIGELAEVLSGSAVAVCNDSGLMHLAAAVGARVVALFGPTAPGLGFAPLGQGHVVLSLGLECSPCTYHGNRPCRLSRRACMEDLMPAEVHRAVMGVLGETADE